MLEKIGLPPKPSMRGSNWVVDASHCQGCSSQFTFINRKHHCRRCGGLFCGSCTQQRMVLRGQGDSPVRICHPCKKLEEAARFELRHGHRNKTSRGGSKLTAKLESEMLNEILGTDIKQSSVSETEASISSVLFDSEKGTTSASSSSFNEEAVPPVDTQVGTKEEIGSCSPEELLQLSLEEKRKYKILKGEGKPDEALRAFKRGKELERQAKALEVALRKNNRKILSSNSLAGKVNEDCEVILPKSTSYSRVEKEKKNDLASELRELGWSDADLHDADTKPPKTSLEGELSTLIGEVRKSSGISKGPGSIDKTQVIALKKKALVLKREGKLAEAKEELKKAKVLEQQLEEQELLADAEDSDDELSSLIRSMDNDKQDDISLLDEQDAGFDFNHLLGVSNDIGLDGNFEVTEQDMEDPDIAAALESLGWTDDSEPPAVVASQSVPVNEKALLDEVLALKKEAVRQKRSGNVERAMQLLRKAKLLERDAEGLQSQGNNIMASHPSDGKVSTFQTAGSLPSRKVDDGMGETSTFLGPKSQPRSKLLIQRELLGLKKRALTLKREGRLGEAEEELRKGKVLEHQLEEMESGSRLEATTASSGTNVSASVEKQPGISEVVGFGEEEDEGDVTEQDMQDPMMLKMLETLGWKDEDRNSEFPSSHSNPPLLSTTEIAGKVRKRSKAEIQRELLGLKRKALTLRRQGETEEADEVLRKAKLLEAQMEEIEVSKKEAPPNSGTNTQEVLGTATNTQEVLGTAYSLHESQPVKLPPESLLVDVPHHGAHDQSSFSHLENLGRKPESFRSANNPANLSEQSAKSEHVLDPSNIHRPVETPHVAVRSKAEIQRELLILKRKALNLRRQGEAEESEEVLKKAKILEAQLEEMTAPKKEMPLDPMDTEPGAGASVSKEEPADMIVVEEVKQGVSKSLVSSKDAVPNLATGSHPNNTNIAIPPSNPPITTPSTSQYFDDKTSLLEFDSTAETKIVEQGSFSQSVDVMDLLTGDGWQSSQKPVELESKPSFSTDILQLDSTYDRSGTSKRSGKVIESKDEFLSKIGEKSVAKVEKAPAHETNSSSPLNSQDSPSDLRQEVLARKRKAVALKREGKLAEAREELRQAKLLEKGLMEDNPRPDMVSTDAFVSTYNETPVLQEEHRTTEQAPKPVTGRDRFKLQQESLAHKRQALKLRREGRTAEADAEFELAKALEAQLEESPGSDSSQSNKSVKETEGMNDLGVEDLLDPQLLFALKAIGIQGAELVQQAPKRVEATKPNSSKNDNASSLEKSQLEERIKAEKVKAVNLKKAGKQAEALDALRRAKMYEKKLNTLG